MPYRVFATNEPDRELEVSDPEFVDLQRMGLLVAGKGDLDADGKLLPKRAKDAPAEVVSAVPGPMTGTTPILPADTATKGA